MKNGMDKDTDNGVKQDEGRVPLELMRENAEISAPDHLGAEQQRRIMDQVRWSESAAIAEKDPARRALLLMESGRLYERRLAMPEIARKRYTAALMADPELETARQSLVRLSVRLDADASSGEKVDTAKALEKAIEETAGSAKSVRLLDLAAIREAEGDAQAAGELYSRAVKEDAENTAANIHAARCALKEGRTQDFLDCVNNLEKVFTRHNDMSTDAFLKWTGALMDRDFESSEKERDSSIPLPGLFDAHSFVAAAASARKGNLHEAASILNVSEEHLRDPDSQPLLRLKGALMSAVKDAGSDGPVETVPGNESEVLLDLALRTGRGMTAAQKEAAAAALVDGISDQDAGGRDRGGTYARTLNRLRLLYLWAAKENESAVEIARQDAEGDAAGVFYGALNKVLSGGRAGLDGGGVSNAVEALQMMRTASGDMKAVESFIEGIEADGATGFHLLLAARHAADREWEALSSRLDGIRDIAGSAEIRKMFDVAGALIRARAAGPHEDTASSDEAASSDDDDIPLYFLMLEYGKDLEHASRVLADAGRMENDEARRAYLTAASGILIAGSDPESALELYTEALEHDPACAPALFGALGLIPGGDEKTIGILKAAADSVQDADLAAFFELHLAVEAARSGLMQQATESLLKAADQWPDDDGIERLLRILDPEYATEKEPSKRASLVEIVAWAAGSKSARAEAIVGRLAPSLSSAQDRWLLESLLDWSCIFDCRIPDMSSIPDFSEEDFIPPVHFTSFATGTKLLRSIQTLPDALNMIEEASKDAPGRLIPSALSTLYRLANNHREQLMTAAATLADQIRDTADSASLNLIAMMLCDIYPSEHMDAGTVAMKIACKNALERDAVRRAKRMAAKERDFELLHQLCIMQADMCEDALNRALFSEQAARALQTSGDTDGALELFTRATGARPVPVTSLLGMISLNLAAGKYREAADAMQTLAEASSVRSRRIEDLHNCAVIRENRLNDLSGAVSAYERIMEIDPSHPLAYSRLAEILKQKGDRRGFAAITEKHLSTVRDPVRRIEIFRDLARQKEALGDPRGTAECLEKILLIDPRDRDATWELASIFKKEEKWDRLVKVLTLAARNIPGAEEKASLYHELGMVFLEKLDSPAKAEGCFLRVLKLKPDHKDALATIAELFRRDGRWPKAVEAYERVRRLSGTADEKIEWDISIARVLDEDAGNPKKAEDVLRQARRRSPSNVKPVEALAAFYSRHRAHQAKSVEIDRAISDFLKDSKENVIKPGLYHDLFRLFSLKGDEAGARMAAAIVELMDNPFRDERSSLSFRGAWWKVTNELKDPFVDEIIFPPSVSSSVRAIIKSLAPYIAGETGYTANKLGLSRSDRINDGQHPLIRAFTKLEPLTQIKELAVYRHPEKKNIMLALSASGPTLVLGSEIVDGATEDSAMFIVGRGLKMLQEGMDIVSGGCEMDFSLMREALNILIYREKSKLLDKKPGGLAELVEKLYDIIPSRLLVKNTGFITEWSEADEEDILSLPHSAEIMSDRAGLLASGSLSAALEGMCLLGGQRLYRGNIHATIQSLEGAPRLWELISFALGREFAQLRERLSRVHDE